MRSRHSRTGEAPWSARARAPLAASFAPESVSVTTASPSGCCATTAWRRFAVFQSLGKVSSKRMSGWKNRWLRK
ncbi:hypothetical protein D3C83_81330 [compost metagenome]